MHGYLRYGCMPQPPSCTRCVDFQHFIFSLLLSFTRYLFIPYFYSTKLVCRYEGTYLVMSNVRVTFDNQKLE
jgi:hypothetical protein